MIDRSNGYEGVAREFLPRRGSGRSTGVGVNAVRQWAQALAHGATVIDLGCGPGFPISEALVAEGLNVFAVDAAPSFVEAFRRSLPNTPVVCEAVQDSIGSWKQEGDDVAVHSQIVHRTVVIVGRPIPEAETVEHLKVRKNQYWTIWDHKGRYVPLRQFKDWGYLASSIRCDREYFD